MPKSTGTDPKSKPTKPAPEAYAPTPREAAALARVKDRQEKRRRFPELKSSFNADGVAQIASDHPDETTALALQIDALGLGSHHEFTSILKGVFNFTPKGNAINAENATEALSLIVGLEPRNTTEALLATQMAAVHLASMDAARRLSRTASTAEAIAVNTKAMNNLARTFAVQAETMKKLKGGGPQRVVVEHKHYHLHQTPETTGEGGGVQTETEQLPHVRELPQREAMLGYLETVGGAMQGAGSDGVERVPLPRC